MRNFKTPDNFPKPIIKESLDRPSLSGRGGSLEDEEIISNNSRKQYIKPDDISDNSYLSYGEDDDNQGIEEDNYMLTDEEIEKEARKKEEALFSKKQSELEWAENHPEVRSAINGEVAHSNSKELVENLSGDGNDESLNEESLGINPISGKMRAESYLNYGINSKIDIRRDKNKSSESCRRDNLKTEPSTRKERRLRGVIRNFFKN